VAPAADAADLDTHGTRPARTRPTRTSPTTSSGPSGREAREGGPHAAGGAGWLIIGLAVAVLAVAGLALWLQTSDNDDQQVETAVGEATAAARTNVPLVLSYDYKNPEAGRDRALQVLTGDLKTDYADLWKKALITNVKKAKAFAKSEVVNAGVACVSDDGHGSGCWSWWTPPPATSSSPTT
jgi:hypothetical protein